jgi:hypothetical protein
MRLNGNASEMVRSHGREGIRNWSGEAESVDFILPKRTQVVFVYCYLANARKDDREIGWTTTAVYDLDRNPAPSSAELAGRA